MLTLASLERGSAGIASTPAYVTLPLPGEGIRSVSDETWELRAPPVRGVDLDQSGNAQSEYGRAMKIALTQPRILLAVASTTAGAAHEHPTGAPS
jgi:hypothetical protein